MPTFPLRLTEEQLETLRRRAATITDPRTLKPMSMHAYVLAMTFEGKLPKARKSTN